MFALTNKPEMGARLYAGLVALATDAEQGTDTMKIIQLLAGVLVETYFVFDEPDEAMEASFRKLTFMLGCAPASGVVAAHALPPAHIMDFETERGRSAARTFFEDWLDCEFEFHELILSIIQNVLVSWEETGQPRSETFRLLVECTKACMGFEIAAQELCDVVIDSKVASEGWSLGDCIASLSAISGYRVAQAVNVGGRMMFRDNNIPDNLGNVVRVMTQEAIRLGVPAGSDWRFGLPANDVPVNAPVELVLGIEPYCQSFFGAINVYNHYDQAVCCAKAAGRMVAVAAGGELPEMEPAIAKPLAMSAITETYKSVFANAEILSC
ncbi:MAG: hypothetical protein KAJ86_06840 [Alphaproteobacteria bacterium]|nr:hypothetical protein [Alphaproteobacteria bacterium]